MSVCVCVCVVQTTINVDHMSMKLRYLNICAVQYL